MTPPPSADAIVEIALAAIRPGANDRKHFNEAALDELAHSICDLGLNQPITVRPLATPAAGVLFEIVAGERRWRAHVLLTERIRSGDWPASQRVRPGYIRAIIADVSAEDASVMMLVENLQRVDLNPLEEANAYKKRIDQFDWTVAQIARVARVSPAHVSARLQLLTLCPEAQALLLGEQLQLQFAQELNQLDHAHQRAVIKWLAEQTYVPTMSYFRQFVAGQVQLQDQTTLFDMRELLCEAAVRVAEDPNLRVSDMLPAAHRLPPLPATRGNPGEMTDAYIATLLEAGHTTAALVLLDYWRKMMKCNKLQIKPWESRVLPLLSALSLLPGMEAPM